MAKDRKFNKTPEWLKQKFLVEKRTLEEIAKECNLTRGGLKCVLKKYGIKREVKKIDADQLKNLLESGKSVREIIQITGFNEKAIRKEMNKNGWKINYKPDYRQYDDSNDEEICSLYMGGFSTTEIGGMLGISHRAVQSHLEHCGIPRRNFSESQFCKNGKDFPEELKDYDKTYELYVTKRLSKKDIGTMLNVSPRVVDRVLREFGIHVRGDSESRYGINNCEKHHNWRGGLCSLYMRMREYFRVRLVPKVLERDGHRCQMCGSTENLNVHHIKTFKSIFDEIVSEHPDLDVVKDVNKLYLIAIEDKRFNDMDNLITYCRDCHCYKVHKYKRNTENVCGDAQNV